MFERDVERFRLGEKEWPYKCDLVVLEKIQNEVGDLIVAQDRIRGFKPKIDEDGVMDRTVGNWTPPDIGLVINCIIWMIEEGLKITESARSAPTKMELMRQDEYTLLELGMIVYEEFIESLTLKKTREGRQKENQ